MNSMQTALIIFLFVAFSVFNIFGQKQLSENPKSKNQIKSTSQKDIPKGWKSVDLGDFSFLLPKSMEDKKVQGIDSAVWRFEDEDFELSIESGWYTNDFQDAKDSYKVQEEKAVVSGRRVKFVMWNDNKPLEEVYDEAGKASLVETEAEDPVDRPFAVGVYFLINEKTSKRPRVAAHFLIMTKTSELRETAKKILRSIKFK